MNIGEYNRDEEGFTRLNVEMKVSSLKNEDHSGPEMELATLVALVRSHRSCLCSVVALVCIAPHSVPGEICGQIKAKFCEKNIK